MTKKISLALLLLAATSLPLFGATQRYMVVTRRGEPAMLRLTANSVESIGERVRRFDNAGSFAADLTEEQAAALRHSSSVESVTPLVTIRALGNEGAELATDLTTKQEIQWGVKAIHAPGVWPVTKGAGVNVAVVDSGIDTTHPDLVAAYKGGYNDIDSSKPPIDDYGHGTHVAGIIAAADNTVGTVGVAPEVNLWAVKVLAADGNGRDENLVAGLNWVIGKKNEAGGAWVVNMSLGAQETSPAVDRAIQNALNANIVLVAASGNDGSWIINWPAAYRGVISVGAVDSNLAVADFSTYGTTLSLVAPGVDVSSSLLRNKFTRAEVETATDVLPGYGVTGSPKATARLPFVNCGYGRAGEFPEEVAGKIAVLQRGPIGAEAITFREKALNAVAAGAAAVVIYNDSDEGTRNDLERWTLLATDNATDFKYPLTIAITHADGVKLLSKAGLITESYRYMEYGLLSGTSMATPHVSGTVALLLALAPKSNPATIQWTLEHSTTDVNLPGWDFRTASGMVDALAAAKLIAPTAFGLPVQPPPPARRRSS